MIARPRAHRSVGGTQVHAAGDDADGGPFEADPLELAADGGRGKVLRIEQRELDAP